MTPIFAFVLGLLTGWVTEWIVDWLYWRRRTGEWEEKLRQAQAKIPTEDEIKQREADRAALEARLGETKAENAALAEKLAALEAEKAGWEAEKATRAAPLAELAPEPPDDLVLISGIGPVIARKLNEAGIRTFKALACLTPDDLRQILGDVIQRLSNEDTILAQAKKFAEEKERAASD